MRYYKDVNNKNFCFTITKVVEIMGQGIKLFLGIADFILIRFFEVEPIFSWVYQDMFDGEAEDDIE